MSKYISLLLCWICPLVCAQDFFLSLSVAAEQRTRQNIVYDPAYVVLSYPNGDVDASRGVCTDLVIRSYRQLDIDLQKLVHEDMQQHFADYPSQRLWGLRYPDANIDHRRVPNLRFFFQRFGQVLRVSRQAQDYRPGDVVTWNLPGNRPHIGIISTKMSADGMRPLVVHNIGAGPTMDDRLFDFPITGHFRYPVIE